MVWVGRDLKDHLVPTPLPWAGTLSAKSGCSKPHPTWPSTLPGMGHPSRSELLRIGRKALIVINTGAEL